MATFGGEGGAGLSVEFYSGLLSRGGFVVIQHFLLVRGGRGGGCGEIILFLKKYELLFLFKFFLLSFFFHF